MGANAFFNAHYSRYSFLHLSWHSLFSSVARLSVHVGKFVVDIVSVIGWFEWICKRQLWENEHTTDLLISSFVYKCGENPRLFFPTHSCNSRNVNKKPMRPFFAFVFYRRTETNKKTEQFTIKRMRRGAAVVSAVFGALWVVSATE